jgi:hypothetical protein
MTQEQRQELIDLSWRYAVLIGITAYEGVVSKEVAEADRQRWTHLIKKGRSGLPVFDEEEATGFMQVLSCMPHDDCREVLTEEWKIP